ncbi:TrbI/VirB10 family protein [Rubrivivax albus]|uniref:Type IV secretion system protein VirB10 n=1 Tax=Rubrivivax albus TaxID=2499835 RepID=A0A437JTZ9_9BURK|nr:TrbI/VirB10 family protein [Rubrivivax albus]RVT50758.1 type IV secretion system protein VirB10 [Rubrivivax albus]
MNEPHTLGEAPLALDGETGLPDLTQPRRHGIAWKGILAVVMAAGSLATVAVLSLQKSLRPDASEENTPRQAQRPTSSGTEPRRLDLSAAHATTASAPAYRVPAIEPLPDDAALPAPIDVHMDGERGNAAKRRSKAVSPVDAPPIVPLAGGTVPADRTSAPTSPDMLEGTRQNLQRYQQQLQGTLDKLLAPRAASPDPEPNPADPHAGPALPTVLFGGQLSASSTPRAQAAQLHRRSLLLPKGTAFTCVLKTRIISAASGLVSCQTQRNLYGDDGRVLLAERGSHLDGEYRIGSVRPGMVRIPVLWTRLRTPEGVTVALDSPGTGPLGEAGIDGHVDRRWGERIGAAMLLSVIDDSVKLVIQQQSASSDGDTVILPSTTANTSRLAEKVLESTINIPPLIYQNQGAIVGVLVARDLDFSPVYALEATAP